jgi:ribA/ribD-fused uncharacterized protein
MATDSDVTPLELVALQRAVEAGQVFRYRHFWGHKARADGQLSDSVFSQWWPGRFEVDGRQYTTAEQFMMTAKAELFGDAAAAAAILASADPSRCKALGRKVRGFDEATWAAARFELVVRGNVAKFGQDARLRQHLLDTGDAVLVEASPVDAIWGIGLAAADPRAADPRSWRGANLLGFALMRARQSIGVSPQQSGPAR